jgi:hypothetical protein
MTEAVNQSFLNNKELARIHAMKKEAGLPDDAYRILLSGAAGVESAKDIATPVQYNRVITALSNVLMAQGKIPFGKSGKQMFRDAVIAKALRVLGVAWQTRLSGYLQKMGKPRLADCNDWELRRIMGFLSKTEKQEKKGWG